jgi:prophage DNA circulation protein
MEERQNLYNAKFKYTGVGVCPHPKFGRMTVVTYAEDFKEDNKFMQAKSAIR